MTSRKNFLINIFLILLLVGYAISIALNFDVYASGSDPSGYMNDVALILDKNLHAKQRIVEEVSDKISTSAYIPLGFKPVENNEMVPTYPFGLPILIALVSLLFGVDNAPEITLWLHAIASIILIYFLAKEFGLEKFWAVIASVLLAINPLFVQSFGWMMSDMPAMFWCSLVIFSALKTRQKIEWAIVSGIAIGVAVMIRPTNILIFIPALMIFGKNLRALIYFGFAGLPFAVLQGFLNYNCYGEIFTTGYGDFSNFFKLEFVPQTFFAYTNYLFLELTPFVVLALAVFWNRNKNSKIIIFWALPFLIFYSFYYFTSEVWWYMRFILPAFPAIILAMILFLRDIHKSAPQLRMALIISFLSLSFFWQASVILRYDLLRHDESRYLKVNNWAEENLPKNAVIFAMQSSGSLFYYTDFTIVRYDVLSRDELNKINVSSRPFFAILHNFELNQISKFPGKWQKENEVDGIVIFRQEEK